LSPHEPSAHLPKLTPLGIKSAKSSCDNSGSFTFFGSCCIGFWICGIDSVLNSKLALG